MFKDKIKKKIKLKKQHKKDSSQLGANPPNPWLR